MTPPNSDRIPVCAEPAPLGYFPEVVIRLLAVLGVVFTASQTASAELSKGQLILIDRGIQIQGMVTRDDVFHLDTYRNAHYTSINWIFDSNPSLMGEAPGFPWSRWTGTNNVPPVGDEGAYMSQMVSMQLADELDLNNPTVRDHAVDWFKSLHTNFPNTIIYMNNWGGQVWDAELGDFINRAKPDMLCFDTYPWKSDYNTRVPIGGPPTVWYSELRRYREHARGVNIPFGVYVQSFHAVEPWSSTEYRDPSPSELRLNHFAALAFNAKVLIDFTYNTGASSLFTKPGGDSYPTALFNEETNINYRIKNFGKALVRLKPIDDYVPGPYGPGYTTSMMFIRGRDAATNANPIPISFLADPDAPNGYTYWEYNRNDPYMSGWSVTNKPAVKNGGQRGDVIISWFKPLDESFDGPNYTNQIYMMVVNGLCDPTGSAADCLQTICLDFSFGTSGITAVQMLDPETGTVQTRTLPVVSTKRRLELNLNGGDAALFKFANGAPFVGFYNPPPAKLNVKLQSGAPEIGVEGTPATRYKVEAAASVPTTNWTTLTNLLLPSTNGSFQDTNLSALTNRFYRAVSN